VQQEAGDIHLRSVETPTAPHRDLYRQFYRDIYRQFYRDLRSIAIGLHRLRARGARPPKNLNILRATRARARGSENFKGQICPLKIESSPRAQGGGQQRSMK
jgi:hypothetical protein